MGLGVDIDVVVDFDVFDVIVDVDGFVDNFVVDVVGWGVGLVIIVLFIFLMRYK